MSAVAQVTGLELMLNELQSHQLVTVLVPQKIRTNEGGMIRVNQDINCEWYRKFCANHPSQRGVRRGKFDTAIRRQHTIRALERMIEGKGSHSPYAEELRRISKQFQ